MNETISKLNHYLEEQAEILKKGVIERAKKKRSTKVLPEDEHVLDEIAEKRRIIRLLSTPKENWDKYAEVYVDFDILERILNDSPLKIREQLHVIFTMFERNLATPILLEGVSGFDGPAIENYEFKTMSKEEARNLIYSPEYARLATTDDDKLTKEEKMKYQELKEFMGSHPLDISNVCELHRNIFEHYFQKKNSFDYEDVKVIIYVLESFGMSKQFCERVKMILDKEVKKREPKEEIVVTRSFHNEIEKNRITEKEYNLLNRELKKYFDLTNMVVVQPLSIEMQIYCVSLMMKMKISESTIIKALKIMNKNNEYLWGEENTIVLFNRIYGRLNYYQDNEELQETVQQLKAFFQEMMICSDDDYVFLKSMMSEELEKAKELVPNTYQYEIEIARGLAKTK